MQKLMDLNTEYGQLLEEMRAFGREREMEVIRLSQIGANYSHWEAELDGREGNLRQREADIHKRERRLLIAEADLQSAQEKEWKVSIDYLISRVIN